jgi:hypothetical protein
LVITSAVVLLILVTLGVDTVGVGIFKLSGDIHVEAFFMSII